MDAKDPNRRIKSNSQYPWKDNLASHLRSANKNTLWYKYIPVRMAKMKKKLLKPSLGKDIEH